MIRDLEREVIRFASELVRIPSLTGQEEKAILQARQEMIRLGYDQVRTDAMGNLIGIAGRGPSILLFDAHIDTVEPGDPDAWNDDPFSGIVRDGMLFGRGSVDMKGAVAAALYAGALIGHRDPERWTVYVSVTVMEETFDGEALMYVLEEMDHPPDAVIICEPSNLRIATGHRGRATLEIITEGKTAHGSMPELGHNAVYDMAELISRTGRLNRTLESGRNRHGSVALTHIESRPGSWNAIPDFCRIILDRRTVAGEDRPCLAREMDQMVLGTRAGWNIVRSRGNSWTGMEISAENYYPAWEIEPDHPLVKAAEKACRKVTGTTPEKIFWEFCTNGVASAGRLNIPTIGLGPGDPSVAHCTDEHCPVEQIIFACRIYSLLPEMLDWTSEEGGNKMRF